MFSTLVFANEKDREEIIDLLLSELIEFYPGVRTESIGGVIK